MYTKIKYAMIPIEAITVLMSRAHHCVDSKQLSLMNQYSIVHDGCSAANTAPVSKVVHSICQVIIERQLGHKSFI